MFKEGRTPIKLEVYVCQHPEEIHCVMSGIIPGDGPFHHHQLILLEWCLVLASIFRGGQ